MTPMSFEIFDWSGIIPGDEIEVIDDGLVIARGVIEDLASDQSIIRLKLPMEEVDEHTAGRTAGRFALSAGNRDPSRDDRHFLRTGSGRYGPITVRHTPT